MSGCGMGWGGGVVVVDFETSCHMRKKAREGKQKKSKTESNLE